jgi:hypothetical protein
VGPLSLVGSLGLVGCLGGGHGLAEIDHTHPARA